MPARRTSGPPPKENRRRRNADVHAGQEVTVTSTAPANVPPLPGDWPEAVTGWYKTWCSSPQAQTFTVTDWQRLHMLAPIVDRYFREPTTALMAEIRLNESLLGATHADRLRARIKVEKPPPEGVPAGVSAIETYRNRIAG